MKSKNLAAIAVYLADFIKAREMRSRAGVQKVFLPLAQLGKRKMHPTLAIAKPRPSQALKTISNAVKPVML